MKNYEAPRFDIVELETKDILQASVGGSGTLTNGGSAAIPGTGVIVPVPGQTSSTSLDGEY